MVFLAIVLILFGFWKLLGRQLHKLLIWCEGSANRRIKSFSNRGGTLPVQLNHIAAPSMSLTTDKSVIADLRQADTILAGYLVCLTKSLFYKLRSNDAASETRQTRKVIDREAGMQTYGKMMNIGEIIKCTVTVIRIMHENMCWKWLH